MKIRLSTAAACLAAAAIAMPAFAVDYPARKPGLWEIQTGDGGKGQGHTMQQCIDAASDKSLHAVMSGDFNSAYRMESKSSYNPPLMGRSEGTSVVEARWVGPCKADQKPGDMVMPNGMKMNVIDMMNNRPKRP